MEETTNLDTFRYEMDSDIASVMPDHWEGHARIAAFEEADGLGDKGRHMSVKLAERVSLKHDLGAEKAASLAVEKISERL